MQLRPGSPREIKNNNLKSGLNMVKKIRFSYGLSIQSNSGKENAVLLK